MKNFNIFGVHWKIRFLGEGRFTKNQYRGGIAWRGRLGQFSGLMKGAWQEKGGAVFLRGVDTLMLTMVNKGFVLIYWEPFSLFWE